MEKCTGYYIEQENGQRKLSPLLKWTGPPPPKGCEVFVGKLPRGIYEEELVPIFARMGQIYEMRVMTDFNGYSRGFAFVKYTRREDAAAAIRKLNCYEIIPGRHIVVAKSVDNCRLFFGGIPLNKTKEDVYEELSKRVSDIEDVIIYKNCFNRSENRGYAFVEFSSHRAAWIAKRALWPRCVKLWDQDFTVNFAEPEPDVDEELMKKVKILFVRNFLTTTMPEPIQNLFETTIGAKVEHVKKMYDYAFIHFYKREQAELAMAKLQGTEVEGSVIEIEWARPVHRMCYWLQKTIKRKAKFNRKMDLVHKLLHSEYESGRDYEGICSRCVPQLVYGSSGEGTSSYQSWKDNMLAPAELIRFCKMYTWAPPIYSYQQLGTMLWVCYVELPRVGPPLLPVPGPVGPLGTRACPTPQQAWFEAADIALQNIKASLANIESSSAAVAPLYPPLVRPVPAAFNVPYNYSIYAQPPPPVTGQYFDNMRI